MAKKDIIEERLIVAEVAVDRLLNALKNEKTLRGAALRRMKLVEQAANCLISAKFNK